MSDDDDDTAVPTAVPLRPLAYDQTLAEPKNNQSHHHLHSPPRALKIGMILPSKNLETAVGALPRSASNTKVMRANRFHFNICRIIFGNWLYYHRFHFQHYQLASTLRMAMRESADFAPARPHHTKTSLILAPLLV